MTILVLIAYDYSRADWGSLRDHLRDVPWTAGQDIHRTAGEGGDDLFNSPLPIPPASQTLRH